MICWYEFIVFLPFPIEYSTYQLFLFYLDLCCSFSFRIIWKKNRPISLSNAMRLNISFCGNNRNQTFHKKYCFPIFIFLFIQIQNPEITSTDKSTHIKHWNTSAYRILWFRNVSLQCHWIIIWIIFHLCSCSPYLSLMMLIWKKKNNWKLAQNQLWCWFITAVVWFN